MLLLRYFLFPSSPIPTSSKPRKWDRRLETNKRQANALAPNWGQTIFQSANEMAANAIFKKRVAEIQAKVPEDKEWWERRRASMQSELLREEGIESPVTPVGNSEDDAILVEGGGPAAGSVRKKKGKK